MYQVRDETLVKLQRLERALKDAVSESSTARRSQEIADRMKNESWYSPELWLAYQAGLVVNL